MHLLRTNNQYLNEHAKRLLFEYMDEKIERNNCLKCLMSISHNNKLENNRFNERRL